MSDRPDSTDPEVTDGFEGDLFALYGRPSKQWDDGGVTARVMRELNSPDAWHRRAALLASVLVGLAGSAIALALVFAPTINDLAVRFDTPPLMLWTTAAAVLCLLAAAATRLVLEE